jgi:hypothetical protein
MTAMMAHEPEEQRRYGEKEIRRLLTHAAELKKRAEHGDASASEHGTGLSLAEVEQIAAELGVEPGYVRAAAAALDGQSLPSRRFSLLGAPASVDVERVVAGEVSEESWELMVPEIRRALRKVGKPSRLGRSFEWTTEHDQDHVSASPRGGHTRLAVRSDPYYWLVIFLPGMLGHLIGVAVMFNLHQAPAVECLMAGAWVTGLFAAQRRLFGSLMAGHVRTVQTLLDRLEAILSEPSPFAPMAHTELDAGVAGELQERRGR